MQYFCLSCHLNQPCFRVLYSVTAPFLYQPLVLSLLNYRHVKLRRIIKSWSRGYKPFFMLNSTLKFFLLINVKMPTAVGILTCMSGENSIFGISEPKKGRISWYFCPYEHLKFYRQTWVEHEKSFITSGPDLLHWEPSSATDTSDIFGEADLNLRLCLWITWCQNFWTAVSIKANFHFTRCTIMWTFKATKSIVL